MRDRLDDLATRGTDTGERASGVEAAIAAARNRIADDLLTDVAASVERATGRLKLSARHTVVAIAGATGSGKSSTYNSLTGLELSSVGIRRPTTSWASAVVWGSEGADDLLQWLGIPPRHQTMRDSMLDTRRDDTDLDGLDGVVLLDLPDHDSTEVAHHLEVDRLVAVADLMVWVLDPQKYADAAVHERYFKPMATHQDVILVVLNHIDTVPADRRQAMVSDVRRLLAADGLPNVTVLPISAKEGTGMPELREEIRRRVSDKRSTSARVDADIAAAAGRLEAEGGQAPAADLPSARVQDVEETVADAAGVSAVVDSLERLTSARLRKAVAWPPFALLGGGSDPEAAALDGEPRIAPLNRSSADTAVRGLADEVSNGVGPAWMPGVRSVGAERLEEVDRRLDRELRSVTLSARPPWWALAIRALHWMLLVGFVGALVWWGVAAVQDKLGDLPEVAGFPLPPVIAVACLVAGLVLAIVGRLMIGGLVRTRAEEADQELRAVVHNVLDTEVVQPLRAEVTSYAAFRRGIDRARG